MPLLSGAELVRIVWLSPAMDRLFVEGASERRRFFDRLVMGSTKSMTGHLLGAAGGLEFAVSVLCAWLMPPIDDPDAAPDRTWPTLGELRDAAGDSFA